MCGLIYIARSGPLHDISALVEQIGRRGPHSHGIATYNGQWQVTYDHGPLKFLPENDWTVLLAHSRLATSGAYPGDLPDPSEGQPIHHGGMIIAHNGTLKHHHNPYVSDTRKAVYFHTETINDIPAALTPHDGAPQAAIALNTTTLQGITHRTGNNGGHPLYETRTPTAHIIASIPTHQAHLIPAGTHPLTNTQH